MAKMSKARKLRLRAAAKSAALRNPRPVPRPSPVLNKRQREAAMAARMKRKPTWEGR